GFGNPAAGNNGQQEQDQADERDFHDFAGTEVAQIAAHEQGDRDGQGHRVHTPGRCAQCVDHDQRQDGDNDDHDGQRGDQCSGAADNAKFFASHLAQGATTAAHGEEQYKVILDTAGEQCADDDPDRAGQI